AHEFQHMIHWGRLGRLDDLWLSEALAHAAEDLVGDELLARADTPQAANFKLQNFVRAVTYLQDVSSTSVVSETPPGTLEMRGGAWLLLKHVAAHYGGPELLGRLTGSTRSGVANI